MREGVNFFPPRGGGEEQRRPLRRGEERSRGRRGSPVRTLDAPSLSLIHNEAAPFFPLSSNAGRDGIMHRLCARDSPLELFFSLLFFLSGRSVARWQGPDGVAHSRHYPFSSRCFKRGLTALPRFIHPAAQAFISRASLSRPPPPLLFRST